MNHCATDTCRLYSRLQHHYHANFKFQKLNNTTYVTNFKFSIISRIIKFFMAPVDTLWSSLWTKGYAW
jgi:hypothetical protein